MDNLKNIIFNVFPTEDYVKEEAEQILEGKDPKGNLSIFYKIDLELLRAKKEEKQQQAEPAAPMANQEPAQDTIPPVSNGGSMPVDTGASEPPVDAGQPNAEQPNAEQPENGEQQQDLNFAASSVVTEDVMVQTNKKVIIKSEEEIKLKESQISEIQSIEDVIDIISHRKSNGVKLFNDFSRDILILLINKNFEKIKDTINAKDSKIYIEIYYGKKKSDSVGFKAVKRQGSEDVTLTVLIDDEIVSMPFDKNRLNRKIIEFRNYEVKK